MPAFLKNIVLLSEVSQDRYRKAHWLLSDFDDPIWHCVFEAGKAGFLVDWRVRIGERGNLLTSNAHRGLLLVLRTWLIFQNHHDATNHPALGAKAEYENFTNVLLWIDYFLIHADHLQLADHGLMAISNGQLVEALHVLASNAKKSVSLYQWPTRLASYLRKKVAGISQSELRALLANQPFLANDIPQAKMRLTELTVAEIVLARCWLWRESLYLPHGRGSTYRWSPKMRVITDDIYRNTLKGRIDKAVPVELQLVPGHRSGLREYPAAPVFNEGKRLSEPVFRKYLSTLKNLGHLHVIGLDVPSDAINALDAKGLRETLGLRAFGRYKNVPAEIVFNALRQAIEFTFQYGNDLVDGFLAVANAAFKHGKSITTFAHNRLLTDYFSANLCKLGVKTWLTEPSNAGRLGAPPLLGTDGFYRQMREAPGLWDLLRVLYGSVQIITGVTMARREGALTDLVAGSSLDVNQTRLIFTNRKSGVLRVREQMARPIPSAAVRSIRLLESIQEGMLRIGILKGYSNLFSFPSNYGKRPLIILRPEEFNHSFDFFCDYFDVAVNADGQRYYFRQHQFRRFFAMLFFWGNQFGGLDTLRWFFGHNNVGHIYNYITEIVPGEVLRSVAADWAAHAVKDRLETIEALSDLVESHFHTRKFQVLKDDELQEYIEELIENGRVTIEPKFLDAEGSYRILVKVLPF